jgi:hypothetical protein
LSTPLLNRLSAERATACPPTRAAAPAAASFTPAAATSSATFFPAPAARSFAPAVARSVARSFAPAAARSLRAAAPKRSPTAVANRDKIPEMVCRVATTSGPISAAEAPPVNGAISSEMYTVISSTNTEMLIEILPNSVLNPKLPACIP